jgi:hypothetical protein
MGAMDQQCLSCGRDTTAGTELFAFRKRGLDREANVEGYLCYPCQEGTADSGTEQAIPPRGRYVVTDHLGGLPGF